MPLSDDRSFDERLDQWLASQGFFLQLRYGSGRSGASGLLTRFLYVMVRVGVLALLALGVGVVFLLKRTDTQAFQDALPEKVAAAMQAESAKVKGFQREGGRVYIHRLEVEGGKASIFYDLEAHEIRYDMGLLDGLLGEWDAGPISMKRATIDLKAGAENEEEAAGITNTLFGKHDWFGFSLIEVTDATVLWGYSTRTRGMIRGSHLMAQRVEDGWLLRFQGGEFSQNWLKQLEIDEMILRLRPGEMQIEKAEFRRGHGRVEITGLVEGGMAPKITAELKFEHLPIVSILPREARAFVDGTISGSGKIGGSTNSQDGLAFDTHVLLDTEDQVTLRDRVPLLAALSVVDIYNNYRRVDFMDGSFHMTTGGGGLILENVDLDAPDLVHLSGNLTARPPTEEEIAATLAEKPGEGQNAYINALTDRQAAGDKEDEKSQITLRRAAKAAMQDQENEITMEPSMGMLNPTLMPMTLEEQAHERYARLLRFEGGFEIEIPGDAFERAEVLRESNPVDPSTGKIRLDVPISGNLFDLTYKQAMEIYSKGKRIQ